MNRWWIVLAVLIAVAAAGGAALWLIPGIPVQAARAVRGEIREFVDERGETRLPETHLVTMPFAGRIEAIALEVGDRVTEGQVVARVSARDLEDEVAEACAAVERIEASLIETADTSVEQTTREQARLTAESMASTVAASEAKLRADRGRIEYAETNLGRIQQLIPTGAQSEDDLERARLALIESEVDYREDALNTEALKTMKLAIDLLPKIAQEYIDRKRLTLNVLEKEKQEAEARLRQAELRRERGVMTSDVDGVVLARPIQNEQFLAAGTTLVEIGRLDQLEIAVDVLSEDVVRIRRGFRVSIYGPAIGADVDGGVAGEVHRIYPAGFTKISSLGVEQQRVTVIVRFARDALATLRTQRDIGVDYRVRARIFTASKESALTIPRSALFRGADRGWAVFAVRDERIRLQPIEVGLMNDDRAEVLTGLQEDDVVVLAPENSLMHGQKVQPILRAESRRSDTERTGDRRQLLDGGSGNAD